MVVVDVVMLVEIEVRRFLLIPSIPALTQEYGAANGNKGVDVGSYLMGNIREGDTK